MQIARGIGDAGFVIASGLARGIDAAAHEAALASGTVAVFAGGLDRPYPPENVALAERIVASGGAHVSEMPMGWEPRARDFPRRNRIISGLSLAVVVVEAATRSGSLITARRAADQGRLVFAVPGSPLDPRSGGTNALIKEGATLVTSAADIIGEIAPMLAREPDMPSPSSPRARQHPPIDAGTSDRDRIVAALGQAPVEIDEIIRFTGLPPAVVHLVLLELDLAGRIERVAGGRVAAHRRSGPALSRPRAGPPACRADAGLVFHHAQQIGQKAEIGPGRQSPQLVRKRSNIAEPHPPRRVGAAASPNTM